MDGVTELNDSASWSRLLQFSHRCFAVPKRGGHRRSLAARVNRKLQEEAIPLIQPVGHSHFRHGSRATLKSLARRVSTKLEQGDYRGAVRTACSEGTIADISEETISVLKAKHPLPHQNSCIPQPPEVHVQTFAATEEDNIRAIRSFPSGSSGGPDGLRPQHLRDLTSASAERGGKELIQALTSFTNQNVTLSVQPVLFGATLIALRKREGGLRPIAVGQTLRRMVAKCVSQHAIHTLGADLSLQQLGCGVPLGGKAAARQYLNNMSPSHLLLKLDFKNAFNCLR